MVSIDEIRKKKEKGQDLVLPVKRSKVGRTQLKILNLLKDNALTAEEISSELKITKAMAYNSARKYEKNNLLVALDVDGKVCFLNKKTAIKEGLVQK